MAFVINVDNTDEGKIQDYLTAFVIAGTPQEYIEAFITTVITTDLDVVAKQQIIGEILVIFPSYDSTGKDLATLQADKAALLAME